jgi:hypothetical protein
LSKYTAKNKQSQEHWVIFQFFCGKAFLKETVGNESTSHSHSVANTPPHGRKQETLCAPQAIDRNTRGKMGHCGGAAAASVNIGV